MKKIEIIELVQDFLSGGDAPADVRGKYHPKIIANLCHLGFNEVIFQTYMEAKMHSDYSVLDEWARNYPIAVATGNRVALPFPPVQLPNNAGIRQVAHGRSDLGNVDYTNTYAFRDTNANSVFAALEVGSGSSTKPWFYLEVNNSTGNNSHVLILGNTPANTTGVTVKMIVPFDKVDNYSDISIPGGKENMIVTSVIELLRQKPPEDNTNDNNVKQI